MVMQCVMAPGGREPGSCSQTPEVRGVVHQHVGHIADQHTRCQPAGYEEACGHPGRKKKQTYQQDGDPGRRSDIGGRLNMVGVMQVPKEWDCMIDPPVDHVFKQRPGEKSDKTPEHPFGPLYPGA